MITITNIILVTKISCIFVLTSASNTNTTSRDYLCNNRTHFACICHTSVDHSLTNRHENWPECQAFVGSRHLHVMQLALKANDWNRGILGKHGYITFEQYFKKRILATVINRYCKSSAHLSECSELSLPLPPENIVILRVRSALR